MSLEWARARLRENCAQMRELHEALGTAAAPAKASLMLVELTCQPATRVRPTVPRLRAESAATVLPFVRPPGAGAPEAVALRAAAGSVVLRGDGVADAQPAGLALQPVA